MSIEIEETGQLHSYAEDLFVEIFCETFGPDKSQYLFVQYPFVDIYGNRRYIDFALESQDIKIAIEIDGETYHRPDLISREKYYDDLLKQNSLIYDKWRVYRWVYNQLQNQRDEVKDQLLTFIGEMPVFRLFDDYLPKQKGKIIELKDHQQEAVENLRKMRDDGESIALLYHATGTGKTVTAVTDAKVLGQRTLFLGHTKELLAQAKDAFQEIWNDADIGLYVAEEKREDAYVVCGSVQSISQNLDQFQQDDFGYIIIDEAHHGTANTYKKILGHFRPRFTLGLTATPERMDGEDILELFKNVAHKLDLETAVKIGELVPIRCIRVKTNIDLSDVRINGIRYNSKDLESKLFVTDRNQLIVDTYLEFVKNRKTLLFCSSVKHAEELAGLFRDNNIKAEAVSGFLPDSKRNRILKEYEYGEINVLCACDLLNEGWDSPRTEVLFMARPTMSKTLYLQQLGRGMRLFEGKDYLMVFDFIDNASLFNIPYSLHRVFNIEQYRQGGYVLASDKQRALDEDLFRKGEKPPAFLDFPIDIMDYELIDLYNWQEEVKDMVSQIEFTRMVSVQSETIERYTREGKIKADLEVPMGTSRTFKYFKEEKVKKYAKKYGWDLITPANMKDKFMEMVEIMEMSYSYKPVILKAIFDHIDDKGRIKIQYIVDYFIEFYEDRRANGLPVEKRNSIYYRGNYTRKQVERNILSNPFKRFEDMGFMKRSKDIEYVKINRNIFKKLTRQDIEWIIACSNRGLEEYYKRPIFQHVT